MSERDILFWNAVVFQRYIPYNHRYSLLQREEKHMKDSFADTLKQFRTDKKLSQQQLADMLFVERTTIANWETGRRIPDAVLFLRISKCLDIDINILLETIDNTVEEPNVIMVDDESIILKGGMSVIGNLLPNASVTGFTSPTEALTFAKSNRVHLAYIDIEMGKLNGLELCRELLKINPRTNVIYLTAYPDYALEAWNTGACGFAVKPLSAEQVRDHLTRLRFPIRGLRL